MNLVWPAPPMDGSPCDVGRGHEGGPEPVPRRGGTSPRRSWPSCGLGGRDGGAGDGPWARRSAGVGVAEVADLRCGHAFGGSKLGQVKRLKALEQENTRLRRAVSDLTLDEDDPGKGCAGSPRSAPAKPTSPSRRRETVARVCAALGASERLACRVPRPAAAARGARRRGPAGAPTSTSGATRLRALRPPPDHRAARAWRGGRANEKRALRIWRREGSERCRRGSRSGAGSGSRTGRTSGFGRSGPTASGPRTPSRR